MGTMAGKLSALRDKLSKENLSLRVVVAATVFGGLLAVTERAWSAENKSGVSPSVISLPSGPGSIEGLGDSFVPDLNAGTASYEWAIELPRGRGGFTPEFKVHYNSGNPNGIFGLGWGISTPFIQRQTEKGLPHYTLFPGGDDVDNDKDGVIDDYDEFDTLTYSSKEELVPVNDRHWRSENESEFVRFQRVNDGWSATRRDGMRLEFGHRVNGRVERDGRVFRWHLERMEDLHGNTVTFEYERLDESVQVYPSQIVYSQTATGAMEARFKYEPRPDVITDFRPRFELKTAYRCKEIAVFADGEPVRTYRFSYAAHSSWRPISLLESVTVIGRDGVSSLPPTQFGYTGSVRADPQVRLLDQAPFVDFDDANVDLLDINADGLPDIIDTNLQPHAYYINEGADAGGQVHWSRAAQMRSSVGLYLGAKDVRLADMNGDGHTDLVNLHARTAIYHSVTEETAWQRQSPIEGARFRFNDPTVVLQDLDHDKRIDAIQIQGNGVFAWINQGGGAWSNRFTWLLPNAQLQFDRPTTLRADMNGDRLLDLVYVASGVLQYYPAIGFGEFGDKVVMSNAPMQIRNPERLLIVDANGDGRGDLVYLGNFLEVWLNQGLDPEDHGRGILAPPIEVRSDLVNAFMAFRQADVNGNGSTDILWNTTINGRLQLAFVDFSPNAQPNLLNAVTNGIGGHTRMHYSSSVSEMVRDAQAGRPWSQTIPFPVPVVSMMEVDDGRNTYRTQFTYRDGYYDPEEKEFRGFAEVVRRDIGDETIPDMITTHAFDTGHGIEALKGKLQSLETRDPDGRLFFRERHDWETRTLARGVPSETRSVTFPFRSTKHLDVFEGALVPTTAQWDYEYDNFGNVTRVVEHGRPDPGWEDERVTETTYTASHPDGRDAWILDRVAQQSTLDPQGNVTAVQRTYYDGNVSLGEISVGNETRVERWVEGERWIEVRKDYDKYGNVIAIYDGEYENPSSGHFRQVHYDTEFSTYPVREIVHTGNAEVPQLEMQASYDNRFGRVTSHTDFNGHLTTYAYDTFGRLTAVVRPGDSTDAPTEAFEYKLNVPVGDGVQVNWVDIQRRELPGGSTVDSRQFYDGLGREIMKRDEGESPGRVIITGAVRFNARQLPWRRALPYSEEGSLAFAMPPVGASALEHHYDALGRIVRVTQPDGSFGTIDYEPFARVVRDEEQTRAGSAHEGAARRFVRDGLQDDEGTGRLREVHEIVKVSDEGRVTDNSAIWVTRYDYDLLDNVVLIIDAQDNRKRAAFDGLGRKILDDDPNRGVTSYEYDAASNLLATLDAKGQRITYEYDGANRVIAEDYHDEGESFSANKGPDVTYVYDHSAVQAELTDGSRAAPKNTLGQLVSVYDTSGESNASYDARGRVEWRTKGIRHPQTGNIQSFVSAMEYDSLDRVTAHVYPDGDRLIYAYNPRGMLESISSVGGPVVSNIDYHPSGAAVRMDYGNGVTTVSEYDIRQRLSRMTAAKSGELQLLAYAYHFDAASNIVAIDDRRPHEARADAPQRIDDQAFVYDDVYRLTRVSYGLEDREAPPRISYRYDPLGNLLEQSSNIVHEERGHSVTNLGAFHYRGGRAGRNGRTSGAPPGPHAATGTDSQNLAYDDNGNVVLLNDLKFEWDFKDRLVSVMSDAGPFAATYTYDHDDRRVSKHVPVNDEDETAGPTVLYVDPTFQVRDGTPVKYVYVNDHRVARLAELPKTATASQGAEADPNGSVRYYHPDHLGSTDALTDSEGSQVADFAYYPYGHLRYENWLIKTETEPYTFSQKELDKGTGIQYFEARYLNGSLARFLSADPALVQLPTTVMQQDTQRLNAYSYAINRPLIYRDISGEFANLAGGIFGVSLGYSLARTTGSSYSWKSAAFDFGTGAIGLGAIRKLSKLSTLRVTRAAKNVSPKIGSVFHKIDFRSPMAVRKSLENLGFKGKPTWMTSEKGTMYEISSQKVLVRVMEGMEGKAFRGPRVVFTHAKSGQWVDPTTGSVFSGNISKSLQREMSHVPILPKGTNPPLFK